ACSRCRGRRQRPTLRCAPRDCPAWRELIRRGPLPACGPAVPRGSGPCGSCPRHLTCFLPDHRTLSRGAGTTPRLAAGDPMSEMPTDTATDDQPTIYTAYEIDFMLAL